MFLGATLQGFERFFDDVLDERRLLLARLVDGIHDPLDRWRHPGVEHDDDEREREHGGEVRQEMRRADEEFGQIATRAWIVDRVDVPDQNRIQARDHHDQTDRGDHSLDEIERHVGQNIAERGGDAEGIDLAVGDTLAGDDRLEFPGDEPIEQTDADGEARIVEREQDVAETEQIALALRGIAFGRLGLERLVLALG